MLKSNIFFPKSKGNLAELNNPIQQMMGNHSRTRTIDKMSYLFTVEENSPETISFLVRYDDFSTETDNPQITAPADYSPLIGSEIRSEMIRQGEIVKLDGMNDLPVLNIAGKGELNEGKYSIVFRMLFPKLPSQPVAFGDSWTDSQYFEEHEAGNLFEVRINYKYTLTDRIVEKGNEYLRIIAEYIFDIQGNGSLQGMPFQAKMDGSGSDTIFFDQDKNMIHSITGESEIKGSAEIDEEDIELSLPMHHKYKETYRIKFK
jgi:hypothetical protein